LAKTDTLFLCWQQHTLLLSSSFNSLSHLSLLPKYTTSMTGRGTVYKLKSKVVLTHLLYSWIMHYLLELWTVDLALICFLSLLFFFSVFLFILVFTFTFLYFGLRQRVQCDVTCDSHTIHKVWWNCDIKKNITLVFTVIYFLSEC